MDKVKDNMERHKVKAKIFLDSGEKAFMKNFDNDLFFCTIIKVEEDYMIVDCFAGHRKGTTPKIYFVDVDVFNEYEELEARE